MDFFFPTDDFLQDRLDRLLSYVCKYFASIALSDCLQLALSNSSLMRILYGQLDLAFDQMNLQSFVGTQFWVSEEVHWMNDWARWRVNSLVMSMKMRMALNEARELITWYLYLWSPGESQIWTIASGLVNLKAKKHRFSVVLGFLSGIW